MRRVIRKSSGKIDDIPHLYQDRSSRYYVRYSKDGIDRQKTIEPQNETFSCLEREAHRAFIVLQKEVETELREKFAKNTDVDTQNPLEKGIAQLPVIIESVWKARDVTHDRLVRLLRICDGLAITTSHNPKEIAEIDAHNIALCQQKVTDPSSTPQARSRVHTDIASVFKTLRDIGKHTGTVPTATLPKPKYVAQREERELTFEDSANIIKSIRESEKSQNLKIELESFVRLSAETGQRPLDLFFFDVTKIANNHYCFFSHKTKRMQRVKHLISAETLGLIENPAQM